MRRLLILLAGVALVAAATFSQVRAALDNTPPAEESGFTLLVLEVTPCSACDLVRKHIEPVYARSPLSRDIPLRYLDLNMVDEANLGLSSPITVVPTIVLMRDGQEISRIVGYPGPTTFFHAVDYMLGLAR